MHCQIVIFDLEMNREREYEKELETIRFKRKLYFQRVNGNLFYNFIVNDSLRTLSLLDRIQKEEEHDKLEEIKEKRQRHRATQQRRKYRRLEEVETRRREYEEQVKGAIDK